MSCSACKNWTTQAPLSTHQCRPWQVAPDSVKSVTHSHGWLASLHIWPQKQRARRPVTWQHTRSSSYSWPASMKWVVGWSTTTNTDSNWRLAPISHGTNWAHCSWPPLFLANPATTPDTLTLTACLLTILKKRAHSLCWKDLRRSSQRSHQTVLLPGPHHVMCAAASHTVFQKISARLPPLQQRTYRISSNSTHTSNSIRPRLVSAPAHSSIWGHV